MKNQESALTQREKNKTKPKQSIGTDPEMTKMWV